MKVTIVTANGETVLNAATGSNLLSLLQSNAFFVDADCGGRGTCGKCKVKLLEGNTSAPLDEGGFFNCCKHTVDGDITIDLNDNTAGAFSAATAIAPHRIKARQGYGLAVDIGTTSIAVYLVDLSNGKPLDSAAQLNRQISFGADVISRINASSGDGLTLMQQSVRTQISAMSEELLRKHNIKEFEKTIIAGNNTMLHLYLGKDPSGMGQAPFLPKFTKTQYRQKSVLLPSAGAFIGSDVVAGVLSSGMYAKDANSLLVDAGTNGEIVLKYGGLYFACATAAGPAFEGASIEKGMGGTAGAIDHVYYNYGKFTYSTVSGSPKGICGSGLTDSIALLLKHGIINRDGLLQENEHPLSNHISDDKFYITSEVYITQRDIREFQLAKSALRSGIDLLLKETGCHADALKTVYLAGGLGYYMDKESALKVGLLPSELEGKIVCAGNTSGKGAIMCLLNDDNITICERIGENIKIFDLNSLAGFSQAFISNMSF